MWPYLGAVLKFVNASYGRLAIPNYKVVQI